MSYKLIDMSDINGKIFVMKLSEILQEINRDRSDDWTDYNISDWREGLSEFTYLKVITEVVA